MTHQSKLLMQNLVNLIEGKVKGKTATKDKAV